MNFTRIIGLIRRRILINYRIRPKALGGILPKGFEPQKIGGWAIGGICQISLEEIRPAGFPAFIGIQSHNAAHRIAVVHSASGQTGVYIPRRDSSSRLAALLGGRFFPGPHGHADFEFGSERQGIQLKVQRRGQSALLGADLGNSGRVQAGSVLKNTARASEFFKAGNIGWSESGAEGILDTIELNTLNWNLSPLQIRECFSGFFQDRLRFRKEDAILDSAFLMQNIQHEWRSKGTFDSFC